MAQLGYVLHRENSNLKLNVYRLVYTFVRNRKMQKVLIKRASVQTIAQNLKYVVEILGDQNYLDNSTLIKVTCSQGHSWDVPACKVLSHCTICKMLRHLNRTGGNIAPVDNFYEFGTDKVLMKCGLGHRFIANTQTGKCSMCKMQNLVSKKNQNLVMDAGSIYVDANSRIRFCCIGNHKHKTVDLYITMQMAKQTKWPFDCAHGHHWMKNGETLTVLRFLEMKFDSRFDDVVYRDGKNIVSGYNRDLKIAFLNLGDPAIQQTESAAIDWASRNGVALILIPNGMTIASKIVTSITMQLATAGVIEHGNVKRQVQIVREMIKKLNSEGLLFEHSFMIGSTDPAYERA